MSDSREPDLGTAVSVGAPLAETDRAQRERIGRYEVRARLGAGATGTVFLAHDDQLSRLTAIKVLHAHLQAEGARARLLREARGLARLSHPNVVQVHEVGEHDGTPFIAMEYVRGRTLRERMGTDPGTWRARLDLLVQCGSGLAAAHEAGLVHRDFKPSNIIIGFDGRLRVLDFGLVRESGRPTRRPATPPDSDLAADLTVSGAVLGTPAYMAPEQIRGEQCTPKTDQFSFCVVAYELLFGRRPFSGRTFPQIALQLLEGRPLIPEPAPGLPLALEQVVMRGLSASPAARWSSMNQVVERLNEIAAEVDLRAYLASRRDAPGGRATSTPLTFGHEAHVEFVRKRLGDLEGSGPALLALTGEAGIGKSSLIEHALVRLVPRTAWVGRAKIGQLQLDNPLAAFFAALDSLASALLDEQPAGARERRREQIRSSVGPVLAALAEPCPALAKYLECEPAPALEDGLAQCNRLRLATERFLSALDAPVVLCFDDLQWADEECFAMVDHLLGADGMDSLTLLVGFRSGSSEAAEQRLDQLLAGHSGVRRRLALAPLSTSAIETMLVGHVGLRVAEAAELARVTRDKTGGNPMRIHQLLDELREEGSLHYDVENEVWTCVVQAIAERPLRLDVAELLAHRIAAQRPEARSVLELLACAGGPTQLSTLARALSTSLRELLRQLWPAIAAGLVSIDGGAELESDPEQVTDAQIRFLHDRIQQAALARLDDGARTRAHYALGRSLLAGIGDAAEGAMLFALTDQLNLGREWVQSDEERAHLISLNLRSGERSMVAAAYGAAVRYFEAACEPDQAEHETLCALARARALAADYEGSAVELARALDRATSDEARVRTQSLALESAMLASNYRAGEAAARAALAMHGLTLPAGEREARKVLRAHIGSFEAEVDSVPVAALRHVPAIDEPWTGSLHDVLGRFTVLAYRSSRPAMMAWAVISLCRASLSARSAHAGYAYAAYAFILVGLSKFARAREMADLGHDLAAATGDPVVYARTHIVTHALIGHYYAPLLEIAGELDGAYPPCLEAGELVHASDLLLFGDYFRLSGGMLLQELRPLVEQHLRFFERFAPAPLEFFYGPYVVFLLGALTGREVGVFSPDAFLATHGASPAATAWYVAAKSKLDVHLGVPPDEEPSLDVGELLGRVVTVERATQGQMHVAEVRAHVALTLLDPRIDPSQALRDDASAAIEAWQLALGRWSAQCPANFASLYALVEAERARAAGESLSSTIELYEQAIAEAKSAKTLDKEALAHRLYGRFWLHRGSQATAKAHHCLAIELYRDWGAGAVVARLEATLDAAAPG